MSLASKAYVEYSLFKSKQEIENIVILAARQGNRNVKVGVLPCSKEFTPYLIQWMKDEGLKVEYKVWKDKPIGPGTGLCDDDELVQYEQYIIAW